MARGFFIESVRGACGRIFTRLKRSLCMLLPALITFLRFYQLISFAFEKAPVSGVAPDQLRVIVQKPFIQLRRELSGEILS